MNPIVLLAGAGLASLLLFGKKGEDVVRSKGPSGTVWQLVNTHTTSGGMTLFHIYTDPEYMGVKERVLVASFVTDGAQDFVSYRNPAIPQQLQDAATSDFALIGAVPLM